MKFFMYLCAFLVWTLGHVAGTQASSGGCSPPDFGMARGIIPNKDITASSAQNSDSLPHHARFSNSKAWVPDRNDRNPWIQVNLQYSRNITAIATQGFSGSYVTRYYVSFSSDGNNWNNYTEQGKVRVFQANVNDDKIKTVLFKPSHVAQYIRLYPTNCSNTCALRFELYGCNSTTGLPGQPNSLSSDSVLSNKIVISWSEPTDLGNGITGYVVRWQSAEKADYQEKVVTGSRSATLDNLTPYTWYDIQVRAENDKGRGPWSVSLQERTQESFPSAAPGNFRVTSNASLVLDITWDAIPTEKQNGKLLGYHIYYKVNGSAVEYNKTVGPDKLVYQLTGLEFTTYVVRIAGYTVVGVGLSTGSVRKQPKGGAPTAPRNLKLTVK
ncbi:contactin-3-like isoform X2 [Stylophora pistillata]|uniref:contactin-3-like isoform X2 n=1 Tax=Stylophora pistillata TaxID=50429 RepID=UPI000C0452FA|nr:contactin-3-like isoform X2 [Stylophora pistillata]